MRTAIILCSLLAISPTTTTVSGHVALDAYCMSNVANTANAVGNPTTTTVGTHRGLDINCIAGSFTDGGVTLPAVSIPYCAAGTVLSGDGGVLYCTTITSGGFVPQVQYNADGGLAGITNVGTDSMRLLITTESSFPNAPDSGALHSDYAPGTGLPPMPMVTTTESLPVGLQVGPTITMEGSRETWECMSHSVDAWAGTVLVAAGSSTGLAFTGYGSSISSNAFDAGTFLGRQKTIFEGTTASANQVSGYRYTSQMAWLGNASNSGGLDSTANIWLNTYPGGRVACGFFNTNSAFVGTVEWSTLTNDFYIGADGTDTNLQACSNDGSGSASCTNLGSNFPKTTGGYQIRFYSAPNSQSVTYNVTRLDTVVADAHGTLSSDMPITGALLTWQCAIGNTDAGQAARLYFGGERACTNW